MILPPHSLVLALVRPQIPQNLGNIARTCVVTGTALHIAGPMPFALDDARIKRSGLDYWPRLRLTVHDSESGLLAAVPRGAHGCSTLPARSVCSMLVSPTATG